MSQFDDTNPLLKRDSTTSIEMKSRGGGGGGAESYAVPLETAEPSKGAKASRAGLGAVFEGYGWKSALATGMVTSVVVLIVNFSVTIWLVATKRDYHDSSGAKTGLKVLYDGSCSESKKTNAWLHLVVNFLSTILLSASNYCMQCLSAPTRSEVDKAHATGTWMDIGVPSMHNLAKISRNRAVLWSLLVLSSLPLHLIFNSIIFSSLSTVTYDIYNVTNSETGDFFSRQANTTSEYEADGSWKHLQELYKKNKFYNFTAMECLDAYAVDFQTSHGSVLLVTEPYQERDPQWFISSGDPNGRTGGCSVGVYDWVCNDPHYVNATDNCGTDICRDKVPKIKKAKEWTPLGGNQKVAYCISEPVEQECKLFFSTPLVAVIIIANAVQIVVIALTIYRPPKGLMLVVGDAIESFLKEPDEFSADSCLVSSDDIKRRKTIWRGPRLWSPKRRRFGAAISRRRWAISSAVYMIAFATVCGLLGMGISLMAGNRSMSGLWSLGFGSPSGDTLIEFRGAGKGDTIADILFVNLPQLCFSLLYFQYNGLFTAMLAAREWSMFGLKRRGIRVADDAVGAQRSRYFLQLPYRWAIPVVVFSTLMHWLLSESLFVVLLEEKQFGEVELYAKCGYSPIAIVFVVVCAAILGLAVAGTAWLRLPTAIPLVGSCSLAIAAACHPIRGKPQPDAAQLPLKWGVMKEFDENADGNDGPGHCGLSSDDVGEPIVGGEYS